MTEAELTALVRRVVQEVVNDTATSASQQPPLVRRGPSHRPLPPPQHPAAVEQLTSSTPARIVTGRTGTRYLTDSYLGLRADHAIALDAVESQIPDGWAEQQGWLSLRTRVADHAEFLLAPDLGRRLDDASKARCEKEADRGVDVQLIAGDGLSALALQENGPPLIKALQQTLPAVGLRVGRPLFVKFARIGVADEIGVLTGAKSTVILVGERPGLGTGDSLSVYIGVSPKIGQDNAEKNCISNVRPIGIAPEEAAAQTVGIVRRGLELGVGGVALGLGWGRQ